MSRRTRTNPNIYELSSDSDIEIYDVKKRRLTPVSPVASPSIPSFPAAPISRSKKQTSLTSFTNKSAFGRIPRFNSPSLVEKTSPKSASSLEIEEPKTTTTTLRWLDKYRPTNADALALHPRKYTDLKSSLDGMLRGSDDGSPKTRLLILSGPAGSAKTAALTVAFSELTHQPISENNNDISSDNILGYYESARGGILEWTTPTHLEDVSIMNALQDFLREAMRRRTHTMSEKTLVLIEDLPNVFHPETRQKFCEEIFQWLSVAINPGEPPLPPLVLVVSEMIFVDSGGSNNGGGGSRYSTINDSLTVEKLLTRDILINPLTHRIKFNPIAKTIAMKPLKSIVSKESAVFKNISKPALTAFLNTMAEGGDIRSSICTLEFWAQSSEGARRILFDTETNTGETPTLYNKQANVGLFHAIGKIIHGSTDEPKTAKVKPVLTDQDDNRAVSEVIQNWSQWYRYKLSPAIFENYLGARGGTLPCEVIDSCADIFSMMDTMPPSLDEACCNIEMRCLRNRIRLAPATRATSSFSALKFPQTWMMMTLEAKEKQLTMNYIDTLGPNTTTPINMVDAVLYHRYYDGVITRRHPSTVGWPDDKLRYLGGGMGSNNTAEEIVEDVVRVEKRVANGERVDHWQNKPVYEFVDGEDIED